MNLNNKGITLVEIIVSVALISIVLVFLFNLLIQVNNENSDNEVKSSYLVNQSTFIKQIEEDFLDAPNFTGTAVKCDGNANISKTNSSADIYLPRLKGSGPIFTGNGDARNIKCLQFNIDTNQKSYVFIYKREETGTSNFKTILSYYKGDFKQSVELEEFDWNMNVDNNNAQLEIDISSLNNMFSYSLPIIGPDYNDYSINLSYAK